MVADSTGAITREEAENYAHDTEYLAKRSYLKKIDLALFSGNTEIRAVVYKINENSGDITSSRPGGVLWPKVDNPRLQIVLFYTNTFTEDAREIVRSKLKINWSPSTADTSHSLLSKNSSRSYASNAYGLDRDDFA
tara:strand:+ start:1024 stop:1431 length:408 start_codon:yes stop_codon:yes gene_type:complete